MQQGYEKQNNKTYPAVLADSYISRAAGRIFLVE